MKNNIFISWHNDKQGIGEKIAKCFHDYLNKIIGKYIDVFTSNVDIKHGWNEELAKALDNCQYAIFILTPQALDSAWMPYEFGTLRQITKYIWCFRFGNVSKDNTPFAINQHLDFSVEEISNMLDKISRQEYAAKGFEVEELTDIKNKIKILVPKLHSDVKAIASRIEKYVCNNTLRQMIDTQQLLQENAELKNRIQVLETQCIHNIIDLGLPSGTLWADRNIGASSPEDYGYYFAWGETKTKEDIYDGYSYTYGDDPKTLPSLNDAATFQWGCNWCMPTKEQIEELIEKCNWKWTEKNGVNGVEFSSKINDNKIFFPTAGCMINKIDSNGKFGYYWSSSRLEDLTGNAFILCFFKDACRLQFQQRHYGFSIRAVQTKNN